MSWRDCLRSPARPAAVDDAAQPHARSGGETGAWSHREVHAAAAALGMAGAQSGGGLGRVAQAGRRGQERANREKDRIRYAQKRPIASCGDGGKQAALDEWRRALFAGDAERFEAWDGRPGPPTVRDHARRLATAGVRAARPGHESVAG